MGIRAAKSTLSRYETEGRVPDIAVLDGLARVFRVSREALIDVLIAELSGSTIPDVATVARRLVGHIEVVTAELALPGDPSAPLSSSDARLLVHRLNVLEEEVAARQTVLTEIAASADRIVQLARGATLPASPVLAVDPVDDDDGPKAA